MGINPSLNPGAPGNGSEIPPQVWLPPPSRGGDAASWVAVLLAILAAAVVGVTLGQTPGSGMLLTALLAGALAVGAAVVALWGFAYRRLQYVLGPEALEVRWPPGGATVPYASIEGVYAGQRLVGRSAPAGLSWPGIFVGTGRVRGVGRLRFYATSRDPADLTLVVTPGGGVVLSPRDDKGFRAMLVERVQLHSRLPAPDQPYRALAPRGAPWTSLFDPWIRWASGAGVALLLATLALLLLRFDDLPERILLLSDASIQTAGSALRREALQLPFGGLVVLIFNTALAMWLHPRDPLLARFLSIAAAVVQAILLVTILRLLP